MIIFIFIIAFFVIAALVMGFIGKIPFIGELGTALLTVPYIFASLLLLFIIISFIVALFFVPAIIATSDEDALGGVFQSFSITYNQLWRIILYYLLLLLIYFLGVFIFALVLKTAYKIFISLFTLSMGGKMLALQEQALHVVDRSLPVLYGWLHSLPFNLGETVYLTSQHPMGSGESGTMILSGYLLGIFLLFFGGIVLAYGEALWNSGLTITYIILYNKQEKENLLEREDEELKEEDEETEGPEIPEDAEKESGEESGNEGEKETPEEDEEKP
jgi:hypothetical protein